VQLEREMCGVVSMIRARLHVDLVRIPAIVFGLASGSLVGCGFS
jgi:hypothetical protein